MIISDTIYNLYSLNRSPSSRPDKNPYSQPTGRYMRYLFTSTESDDFRKLLEAVERPLFCYTIELTGESDPSGSLGRPLKYLRHISSETGGAMLLVPWLSSRQQELKVSMKQSWFVLRDNLRIVGASLYSKDNPRGFVSNQYVSSIVNMVKNGMSEVDMKLVATARELSMAIWKSRGKLRIMTAKQFGRLNID